MLVVAEVLSGASTQAGVPLEFSVSIAVPELLPAKLVSGATVLTTVVPYGMQPTVVHGQVANTRAEPPLLMIFTRWVLESANIESDPEEVLIAVEPSVINTPLPLPAPVLTVTCAASAQHISK